MEQKDTQKPALAERPREEVLVSPEIVENIEKLPLNSHSKMEILLIALGRKPMTDIEFRSQGWMKGKRGVEDIDSAKRQQVQDLLEQSKLVVEVQAPTTEEYATREYEGAPEIPMERMRQYILVARTPEALKGYHEAVESQDDEALGRFFGFPESAIEAYNGVRESIKRWELPQNIKDSEYYPFIQFGVLSKDNWASEIDGAELNARAVKQTSPKIFAEYSQDAKKVVEWWD